MPGDAPILTIRNLTKQYGRLTAIDDVTQDIRQGEIYSLLGPNGAGKTTLISCVCGLIQDFSGNITVAGFDVRRDYRITRQVIGVVPQELNFDGFSTARQTLIYQGGMFGLRDAGTRADELLEVFGLTDKAETNTRTLSGGMKRRLMICKALMPRPALVFLDEPTAGVDVELRDELWQYVRTLRETEGMTIVLTTHYLNEAEELADRIGILNRGRLILEEERDALISRFGTRWLKLRFDRPVPDALLRRLETFAPHRLDDDALYLTYPDPTHEGDDGPPAMEFIMSAVADAPAALVSVDGGRSSLESIFRDILKKDQSADAGGPAREAVS